MNAFVVEVENRPGEMARVTEVLAAREVNLLVYSLTAGTRGSVTFIADDEGRARSALREKEIAFREVPLVHIRMKDIPGQAAAASRKLAGAGVNIEAWLPVDTRPDTFTVAVGVDDADAAKEALRDQLTTWTYH